MVMAEGAGLSFSSGLLCAEGEGGFKPLTRVPRGTQHKRSELVRCRPGTERVPTWRGLFYAATVSAAGTRFT